MSTELSKADAKPRTKEVKVQVKPDAPHQQITAHPDEIHMGHHGPVRIVWTLEKSPQWQFKSIDIEQDSDNEFYDHGVGRDPKTGVATAWVWNKNSNKPRKAYKYSISLEHIESRKTLELDPSIVNRSDG